MVNPNRSVTCRVLALVALLVRTGFAAAAAAAPSPGDIFFGSDSAVPKAPARVVRLAQTGDGKLASLDRGAIGGTGNIIDVGQTVPSGPAPATMCA